MGGQDEVELGGQVIGVAAVGILRLKPVAREDGQLAVRRELLETSLHLVKVAIGG